MRAQCDYARVHDWAHVHDREGGCMGDDILCTNAQVRWLKMAMKLIKMPKLSNLYIPKYSELLPRTKITQLDFKEMLTGLISN